MLIVIAPFFFVGLWFAFIGAIAYTIFSIKRARQNQRAREMQAAANEMGLSYEMEDTGGLLQQLKNFDLFSRFRRSVFKRGRINNVIHTTMGETDIYLFDYSYVVSTGKSSRRISQTVFFANDRNWYLPNFTLKPETLWHKIIKLFGVKDIDFQNNPEFSEKFWVDGHDKLDDLIRQKFGPDLQHFLLSRPPLHLEGNNFYLIGYKPRALLNPAALQDFLDSCKSIVQKLKSEGKMELLDLAELKKEDAVLESREKEMGN